MGDAKTCQSGRHARRAAGEDVHATEAIDDAPGERRADQLSGEQHDKQHGLA